MSTTGKLQLNHRKETKEEPSDSSDLSETIQRMLEDPEVGLELIDQIRVILQAEDPDLGKLEEVNMHRRNVHETISQHIVIMRRHPELFDELLDLLK